MHLIFVLERHSFAVKGDVFFLAKPFDFVGFGQLFSTAGDVFYGNEMRRDTFHVFDAAHLRAHFAGNVAMPRAVHGTGHALAVLVFFRKQVLPFRGAAVVARHIDDVKGSHVGIDCII